MEVSGRKIRLVGSVIPAKSHICAFFNNKEEEHRTLLPFIRDGLADGERVVRIVHPVDRDEIRERMRDDGIDVDAAQKRGQLDMLAWPRIDLGNGGFNADHAIALVEDVLIAEHKQGYPRVRIFGDWAFRAQVYMDDFISLEARLNTTMSKYDDPMICAYDLSRVSGGAVLAAMRTHPIVIIAGVLQQNPFYVSPEQLMSELHENVG